MFSDETKTETFVSDSDIPSIGHDAFDVETLSQLNHVLSSKRKKFSTSVEFIVHTSTMPLSTILTIPCERKELRHHGSSPDTALGCIAGERCMFTNRAGHQSPQEIPDGCPCLEFKDAEHLCFLSVLPSIGYKLDPDADAGPKYPLESIMWCTDAQSIFDASYGAHMQRVTHKKGWNLLSENSEVLAALDNLYWFKFVPDKFRRLIMSRPILSLKSSLYNILQTIDGLLLKLIFCFPLETRNYRSLSERTASMFGNLLTDYCKESTAGPSVTYKELKPYLQEVGLLFHSRNPKTRLSLLDGELGKYTRVHWFFIREMTTYRNDILNFWSCNDIDLTETLSWKTRMAMFCKTRVLGHVPECDAYPSDLEFLEGLQKAIPLTDDKLLRNIGRSVPLALSAEGVKPGGLRELYSEQKTDTIGPIVEQIDLDVKLTADTSHTRHEGGKCESGRVLIDKLRTLKLKIPIRHLVSGKVIEEIDPPAINAPGYKRAVFWASLQVLCQDLSLRFPAINQYPVKWPQDLASDLFSTEMVRINEPGKIRRLVKTSNEINAALAIGSHLLASELAKGKSHSVGMLGSNQSWNFETRLDRKSDESAFLYNEEETRLKPDIVCGFQDWSRASDFVSKPIGLTLLAAAHRYVAFPAWYSELIQMALAEPLHFQYTLFNTGTRSFEDKEGWILNGFMMGLQNTKNILHLIHYSCGFYAESALIRSGWVRTESRPYERPILGLSANDLRSVTTSIIRNDNG